MTAIAEIVVNGCSRVLGLLTTGGTDSYVTMAAVHFYKISKASWAG